MSDPNRNTLWGRLIAEELASAGVDAACVAPGSRSTPITVALDAHDDIEVFSHLDERSAGFFALGRGRRTGRPTAIVCTSGTAAANFHPAVIEADRSRVPLLVLTADRPSDLRDSGANQTIDQVKLYGDAVRWYRELPEPEPVPRTLRSLRTTISRSVGVTAGTPPGPVHLNIPFRKPLEPVEVPDDLPDDLDERDPLATNGRAGPFVETTLGRPEVDSDALDRLSDMLVSADRPLIVAGPDDEQGLSRSALAELVDATNAPVLADPLSGLRFGPHARELPVCGGYDAYVGVAPEPDVVLRFGASPTSQPLCEFLQSATVDTGARQILVDPAGEWREAEFTATDLVVADPTRLVRKLASRVAADPEADATSRSEWCERWQTAERRYWDAIDAEIGFDAAVESEAETGSAMESSSTDVPVLEGSVLADVAALTPDPSTVFVSNSMPVRDLDRFARPRAAAMTVLGNRGASGIDGIISTALGAGSATDEPLVLVTGDLAFYHDMNGLLALERCGVDATIVLLNNDGGGIFHMLPIEEYDPPFTGQFKTPHGLDFSPTADLYGLDFVRVEPGEPFREAFREAVEDDGSTVIEVSFDAHESHRRRDAITEAAASAARSGFD